MLFRSRLTNVEWDALFKYIRRDEKLLLKKKIDANDENLILNIRLAEENTRKRRFKRLTIGYNRCHVVVVHGFRVRGE